MLFWSLIATLAWLATLLLYFYQSRFSLSLPVSLPSLSLPSGCPPDCLAVPFQPFCLCSSSPVVYCCYRLCFMYTAAQPQLVFRHAVQFQCFSCLLNLPSLPFPDCHPCLACYPAALLLSVPLFSFLASFLSSISLLSSFSNFVQPFCLRSSLVMYC